MSAMGIVGRVIVTALVPAVVLAALVIVIHALGTPYAIAPEQI
jgi:hypothetical protein